MYLIVSGRYQPPHRSHINFLEHILATHANASLIVNVLENPESFADKDLDVLGDDNFAHLSSIASQSEKNILPNWHRIVLMNLAVQNSEILSGRTYVLPRVRPEYSWRKSVANLPKVRTWVFNEGYDHEFSAAKIDYYKQRGENVLPMSYADATGLSGTDLRAKMASGENVHNELPEGCIDYFERHCRKFFEE